jgi:3',5'-cyclic AMP phosphodiesterase CpdA
MTQSLKFAQISDIHLSMHGNRSFNLSEESAGLLADAVRYLNSLPDLDFVFVSGDVTDNAHQSELNHFQSLLAALEKPAWVIPGNHDGNPSTPPEYMNHRQFAAVFNPQYQARPAEGQAGYFSVTVKDGFQLIALDTNVLGAVGGTVDAPQLAWLQEEIRQHRDKFIIIGCHHPLHPLTERDQHGNWRDMFMMPVGPDVQAILDAEPAVKLVLYGHHHMSKLFRAGQQLHVASPALVSYPCAYRIFQLQQDGTDWQISWEMQGAPPEVEALAAQRLHDSDFVLDYDPDNMQAFVDIARGQPFEWKFAGKLSNLMSEL